MGLLRPYQQRTAKPSDPVGRAEEATDNFAPGGASAAGSAEAAAAEHQRRSQTPKKGRPTRSRAQAEAERMARLHPTLTPKERKRAAARARAEAREAQYGQAQSRPERLLMRDYVDSRWTLTEFILPLMLVVMALSFAFPRNAVVQTVIMAVMVALLAGWMLNVWLFWRGYKREAIQRLDHPNFRGVLLEMNSRMMNIRRFRNPGPRINRGGAY